jgi:hypothetical protein
VDLQQQQQQQQQQQRCQAERILLSSGLSLKLCLKMSPRAVLQHKQQQQEKEKQQHRGVKPLHTPARQALVECLQVCVKPYGGVVPSCTAYL